MEYKACPYSFISYKFNKQETFQSSLSKYFIWKSSVPVEGHSLAKKQFTKIST